MSEQVRRWQVSSTAEWRGPFGDFIYTPNKVRIRHFNEVQYEWLYMYSGTYLLWTRTLGTW